METADGCYRVFFDGVGHGDDAGQLSVDTDHHGGLSFVGQSLQCLLGGSGGDTAVGHELEVAQHHVPVVHGGFDAVAGNRIESACLAHLEVPGSGAVDDCLTQGMLGPGFGRSGQRQDVILGEPVERDHICQRRFALGDGPGLVQHDGVHPVSRFEGVA